MLSQIDPNDFKIIIEYLPISFQFNLRLVCQKWCRLVTPLCFKYVTFKMLTSDNSDEYVTKFGSLFTHLIPSGGSVRHNLNISTLPEILPNLIYFDLSTIGTEILCDSNQIINSWPNLKTLNATFISQRSQLGLYKCRELQTLHLRDSMSGTLIQIPTNSYLPKSLTEFYWSMWRLDLFSFSSFIKLCPNLTLLELELDYYSMNRPSLEDCDRLMELISNIPHLKKLRVKLELNPSNMEIENNRFEVRFPKEFKMHQLEELTLLLIFPTEGDYNPSFLSITLSSIIKLFNTGCTNLKYLELCDINTPLLDSLLVNCYNLETLILHSALPKLSVRGLTFPRLTHLQIFGFMKEAIEELDLIRYAFPKVTKLYILNRYINFPYQGLTHWNLIPLCFPNVQHLTLHQCSLNLFPNINPIHQLSWKVLVTSIHKFYLISFLETILPLATELTNVKLNYDCSTYEKMLILKVQQQHPNLKFYNVLSSQDPPYYDEQVISLDKTFER